MPYPYLYANTLPLKRAKEKEGLFEPFPFYVGDRD
jgi:hypothetical protein